MHLNDVGQWAVLWLNKVGSTSPARSAWAFFHTKLEAEMFLAAVGGELYARNSDGSLKRSA